MKNLKKLSKKELKTVQGGIPMCLPGYFWCSFVKKCIPVGSSCGLEL
ncbi:bacteriocin [Chryseobacterium antibioticum]|uniref:Bacteriocin n=1 Tax=Chryseobacterium pyrolae TaxID=2987481 RepID=A0ABT2ICI9_9FLAO|nr:bacteriocin [Chryseobacterium pyrolae]MCT2406321.1 bacteriocin [Chryseobacterium pyrolae]